MSRCHHCLNRFLCEGDECQFRYDPWPEETQERWEERQAEELETTPAPLGDRELLQVGRCAR